MVKTISGEDMQDVEHALKERGEKRERVEEKRVPSVAASGLSVMSVC
jgi:hypothetical protein